MNIMHHTKNSLSEKDRVELIPMLNTTLASLIDLYTQVKQAHWNVKGQGFFAVHELLDDVAEQVEEHVDIVAERAVMLGGTALGTLEKARENTQLRTYPVDIYAIKDHIEHLTHNIAILSESAREYLKDAEQRGDIATSDVYVALLKTLDKNLWFLEAHVQK